jgi:hypothetical protein
LNGDARKPFTKDQEQCLRVNFPAQADHLFSLVGLHGQERGGGLSQFQFNGGDLVLHEPAYTIALLDT